MKTMNGMPADLADLAPPDSRMPSHLLLDQLPMGILQKDKEGRFVFVNSWYCRLTRRAADHYLGKKASDLDEATIGATTGTKSCHETIMETGQSFTTEDQFFDADGNERHLQCIEGPVVGPNGQIIGSRSLILDITERKKFEAQFANERDLLRALMDSATDAIYFKDRQSRFLRCSKAMAPLFKIASADELIGKSDFDFFGKDFAQEAFDCEQEILRSGRPTIGKIEKEKRLDGRLTWALASKMPLYNNLGEIIGTFGINKDITAIKESEAKVEELHKQLLQTSRQAGMAEVAISVLHNVGNVLNSVNVSATLLLENAKKSKVISLGRIAALLDENAGDLSGYLTKDPKGKQLPVYVSQLCEHLVKERQCAVTELENLRQNIEHINEIVAMQQNYARVCGVTESVKVADLIDDALRMHAAALQRHEVSLIRKYADVPNISVEKHKLLQILVNIIHNAQYACAESGREDKQITISVTQRDQRVGIAIVDNGVGIPPENLTRIFNHGFTTWNHGQGFGLHNNALAAVELGGTLTAQSDGSGKGATFLLELPLQPAAKRGSPAL